MQNAYVEDSLCKEKLNKVQVPDLGRSNQQKFVD